MLTSTHAAQKYRIGRRWHESWTLFAVQGGVRASPWRATAWEGPRNALDIAKTIREAKKIVNLRKQLRAGKGLTKCLPTETTRSGVKEKPTSGLSIAGRCFLLEDAQTAGCDLPTVSAVTFAAPRVGDRLFAQRFGPATLMAPPFAPGWHIITCFTLLDFIPYMCSAMSPRP
eukprot:SM000366S13826  [mRNA]  locus=s366:70667:71343:+ [translate_table: standard]